MARVLRMGAGAPLTLFNGDGHDYDALIVHAGRDTVSVRIAGARTAARESPLDIRLAQGISRGERMDYTVQKAVELGVTGIEPIVTSRSVVRLDAARARQKAEHWQAVVVSACEQCGRNRLPLIGPVTPFSDWLALGRGESLGILLDPASDRRLGDLPRPSGGLTLLAGPEGGLTAAERQDALRRGFVAVRLGPRVLRTETAALAALAAIQVLWGDF